MLRSPPSGSVQMRGLMVQSEKSTVTPGMPLPSRSTEERGERGGMTTPTIFETCRPRDDVLSGAIADADFAADLAAVITGRGSVQYGDPIRFFADTYPTRGLKNLLANVCRRLSGAGGEVAAIFRLDTAYGGGKTHGLIALAHAAKSLSGVPNISEFLDANLLPSGSVRIAAFDGENADPANGRAMGDGVLAYTPWGEIAYALAGKEGYERIRRSDETGIAPGAETLRQLFGGEPALILLDELSVYLRKVWRLDDARAQLTAFLTTLFKAVEGAPQAALVYTLAIGKDGSTSDAYTKENQYIAEHMAEAESVSARKATLLNPTEEDETVQVLRRRLFEHIDEAAIGNVVEAYRGRWAAHRESLSNEASHPETVDAFRASYPLHPEVLETLTGKTATLANFQRVRGMLRLLARTIAHLWDEQPGDATAIHPHHINPGYEPIRQEIVTRLGQNAYDPAISNDISGGVGKALAEEIDERDHAGMPPYASYAARTIFLHTLAFNEPLRGISPEELRYSILSPATDVSFIEQARKSFVADSAYLDDRPVAETRMRFLAMANLRQIIRREERHVDAGEARSQLDDRIKAIFGGQTFDMIPFASGPFDVPDEVGDGRPKLVLIHYDALTVGATVDSVPELIQAIYERKGAEGKALRSLRNHLVFLVSDDAQKDEMQRKIRERLALQELKKPERLLDLAEHQQDKVRELETKSEQMVAVSIQQCYRHVLYPSRNRIGSSTVDLAHSALDIPSASQKPGPVRTRSSGRFGTKENSAFARTSRTHPRTSEIGQRSSAENSRPTHCQNLATSFGATQRFRSSSATTSSAAEFSVVSTRASTSTEGASFCSDPGIRSPPSRSTSSRWCLRWCLRGTTGSGQGPSRSRNHPQQRSTGMAAERRHRIHQGRRHRPRRWTLCRERSRMRGCSGKRWSRYGNRRARRRWRHSRASRSECSRRATVSGCLVRWEQSRARRRQSRWKAGMRPVTAGRTR